VHGRAAVLDVCNIAAPRTGLEVKFSIRQLAALALDGADTADLGLYTEATAQDPRLAAARDKIAFEPRELSSRSAAMVVLETGDGRRLTAEADVGVPAADPDAQWRKLVAKARSIAAPVIGPARADSVIAAVAALDEAASVRPLMKLLA
jgi:hypothetical protein